MTREDDRAAAVIVAVGVEFPDDRLAGFPGDAIGLGNAHAEDEGIWRDCLHQLDERARKRLVDRKFHVERTMRLHMLQVGTMAPRELPQGADLIGYIVDDLVRGAANSAATEALQVLVAGMGADPDAILRGKPDCCIHHIGIAGMEAGCDVGGTDQRHQRGIVGVAQPPLAEALPHVAIQVHDRDRHAHPPQFPARMDCASIAFMNC